MVVMHTCDNPVCVNPGHLVEGTQADNMADCKRKGQKATGDRNGMRRPEVAAKVRGENHPLTKLTTADVAAIRRLKAEGASNCHLGRLFKVHGNTIRRWLRIAPDLGPRREGGACATHGIRSHDDT
jgi:hypothetical protein